MQTYLVGGAVRDELLGLPVGERDWVVVGATPEAMQAQGYKPVGRHFPVFLHPDSGEEYALARTERKTAPGYHGFQFHTGLEVTLEDDLQRRDLTINAIARDDQGRLIDPYGGQRDIDNKVLRHVSAAFVEDPVRVLRVARFAARFASLGFRIADETVGLMRKMVDNGEINALIAERVWKECEIALREPTPSRFFTTLHEVGALSAASSDEVPGLAPGLTKLLRSPSAMDRMVCALDGGAGQGALTVFAALALQAAACDIELEALCKRLRAPSAYAKVARAAAFCQRRLSEASALDAQVLLDVFERSDAFRNPARLTSLLNAWRCCDFPIAGDKASHLAHMRRQFEAARQVNLQRVAETAPRDVAQAVRSARLEALSKNKQEK